MTFIKEPPLGFEPRTYALRTPEILGHTIATETHMSATDRPINDIPMCDSQRLKSSENDPKVNSLMNSLGFKELPADLKTILAAWPQLPEAVKVGWLATARAICPAIALESQEKHTQDER